MSWGPMGRAPPTSEQGPNLKRVMAEVPHGLQKVSSRLGGQPQEILGPRGRERASLRPHTPRSQLRSEPRQKRPHAQGTT
eukprot:1922709-Pyramimonas_sp.AAC.1